MQQIPLAIQLPQKVSFLSFLPGPNGELLKALTDCASGQTEPYLIYFWGGPGTGKTHLLQAACQAALEQDRGAAYVPLHQWRDLEPALLEDMEQLDLVCVDNIECACGQPPWEEALFVLCNRLREHGRQLLVSAKCPPGKLPLELPDLGSRLAWGPSYQLQPLDDTGCLQLLQQAATERGMSLDKETARYILHRFPRDTRRLIEIIEQLDRLSLAQKRRPTIPLIRQLLHLA